MGAKEGAGCGALPGQASLPRTERSGLTSGHQRAAGTHTRTAPTCRREGWGPAQALRRSRQTQSSAPRVPGRGFKVRHLPSGGKVERGRGPQ